MLVSKDCGRDIDRTERLTPLASSRATMANRSPTYRASRSSLVTANWSPSRVIERRLKVLTLGNRGDLLSTIFTSAVRQSHPIDNVALGVVKVPLGRPERRLTDEITECSAWR